MKEKIITLNKSLLTVLSMMFFIILAFNENVFAADSDIVNIPDAEFKALLNEELGVEDTTADITKGQLATITEIVFERDDYNRVKNIKSITGIEYCNNLTRLDLMNCYELTDISPIKGLTNLYSLSLRNCTKISDISHIKDLTQITYLDLYNCTSVSDISVLKYLTKLGWVELYNTKITNISSLENLTKLYIISLSCCTELESISPLKNKPNLKSLDLTRCVKINDISMLKDSTNLLSLSFKYCNNITDISVISNFSELSTLDMYCCEGITDISPLSNLTELYDLNIAYCKGITDISPLKNLKYIHKLYLGYLYFTDKNEASYMETISSLTNIDTLSINYCNLGNEHTSMFKNLTNLRYLNLHNNNITDFSFLKDFVNLEYKGDNYSTVDLTLFDNITDYSIPNDIIDDDGNYVKPVESELYDYNETTNEIILNIDKFSETGNNYVVYEFVLEVNDSYKTTIKHEKKINITKFSPTLSIFNYYTSSMNTTKGDFIQLNVNVTHGKISDYKYKFAVLNKSNNTWYVLRDFDSNPTLDYNLNYTGTKIFAVTVMDSRNNTIATNRVEVNVYDPLKSSLTINNSTNKIVCQMGSKITLKGNGKGGSGDYTYSFLEYNVETEKWTILTDFITSSAYTHTLDCAGEKKFAVNIKDSTKKLVTSNLIPVTVYKPLKGNLKVNGSKNAIVATKGDKINLIATGYYGSEVYTYKFAVLNEETGKWSLLRDFSSNNTLEYALDYIGKKQFAVTIMDSYGNTVATNRLEVTVYAPLKGNLKVNGSKNAIVATKGDKINLVATGYYGSEVYTYKFAVLNEETGKWSLLRDFSSNNTLEYSLNYTGKKQFAVTIMDTYGNTVATNRLSVTVTE